MVFTDCDGKRKLVNNFRMSRFVFYSCLFDMVKTLVVKNNANFNIISV